MAISIKRDVRVPLVVIPPEKDPLERMKRAVPSEKRPLDARLGADTYAGFQSNHHPTTKPRSKQG